MVLQLVGNDERHLGFGLSRAPLIATHGDQAVVHLGHEGEAIDIVDTREVLHLLRGEFRVAVEEP
jgi:hypothetical protein